MNVVRNILGEEQGYAKKYESRARKFRIVGSNDRDNIIVEQRFDTPEEYNVWKKTDYINGDRDKFIRRNLPQELIFLGVRGQKGVTSNGVYPKIIHYEVIATSRKSPHKFGASQGGYIVNSKIWEK